MSPSPVSCRSLRRTRQLTSGILLFLTAFLIVASFLFVSRKEDAHIRISRRNWGVSPLNDVSDNAVNQPVIYDEKETGSVTTESLTPTDKQTPKNAPLKPDIPIHVMEIFEKDNLQLVALDPALLRCIKSGNCAKTFTSYCVHLGTWLPSMSQFDTAFRSAVEGPEWNITVVAADTVIIKKHHWMGYQKFIVVSVIEDDPEKDYFKVNTNLPAEVEARAIKRFNTTVQHGIVVPDNIDEFIFSWERGRFLECRHDIAEKYNNSNPKVLLEHIESLSELSDMMLRTGQVPMLLGGTLLGWYRECGVIPYTNDLDMAIKAEEMKPEFFENFANKKSGYRLVRRIGRKEYGLEYSVRLPTKRFLYVDVFYLYPHNTTLEWTTITYGKSSKYHRLRFLLPKITEVCTGDLMNHLFFVPCNTLEYLEKTYGKTEWLQPQKNYVYTGHDRLVIHDGDWNVTIPDIYVSY